MSKVSNMRQQWDQCKFLHMARFQFFFLGGGGGGRGIVFDFDSATVKREKKRRK